MSDIYVHIGNKSTVTIDGETQIRYQGAKFNINGDISKFNTNFDPKQDKLYISVGFNAFQSVITIIEQYLQCDKYSMSCIEIQNQYVDLHSETFKYLKLFKGKFDNLLSPTYDKTSQNQLAKQSFMNRMTVKNFKHSNRTSYLFTIKKLCDSAECTQTHGQVQFLVVGQQHRGEVIPLLEMLKGGSFEKGIFQDLFFGAVYQKVDLVLGFGAGEEDYVMQVLCSV